MLHGHVFVMHCENVSKGSNYFSRKKYNLIFHLKCAKLKQNCIVYIAESQTLENIPWICSIFNFNVFGLPPLHMQKGLYKIIFGHKCFISEQIFKMFAALFTTFGMQKDYMVIFFLRSSRKVRF